MGGMGFIESHKAECMLSVLINTHMLMAAAARLRTSGPPVCAASAGAAARPTCNG